MAELLTFDTLLPKLVNLRTVQSSDLSVWEAIANGELVSLSSQWFIPADLYKDLDWYKKRILKAFAVGRTAQKAVIAGRSAARIHRIWTVSLTPETVEMVVPSGAVPAKRDRDKGVSYYYAVLNPSDIHHWNGVRLTKQLRTVIDICRYHGEVEGVIACDWALANGFTREALSKELLLLGRRKGVATARKCIAAAIDTSESAYESLARAILIQAGITGITVQVWVDNYRVDVLIDGFLIIEVDGDIKYKGENRDDIVLQERDREKRLLNWGYRVVRYRPIDLTKNPDRFVAEIKTALEARNSLPPGATPPTD
ncbi:DUF559 domain-containing protein [Corynebacterium lubricantis]|uniref:DUF559 domain-containing protein n=1 Tax=Corynebacterium lubricantis TaxID=541095 RepID=UPI00037FDF12|nr:DUF559 domain-containing protein [Corynebacterium lubricantis]